MPKKTKNKKGKQGRQEEFKRDGCGGRDSFEKINQEIYETISFKDFSAKLNGNIFLFKSKISKITCLRNTERLLHESLLPQDMKTTGSQESDTQMNECKKHDLYRHFGRIYVCHSHCSFRVKQSMQSQKTWTHIPVKKHNRSLVI